MFTFETTKFTPSEAEAITGMSAVMQRDHRRHGYLPANKGHARFDVFGLARMLAMTDLAARGVGPRNSIEIADACASAIAYSVMSREGAIEADLDDMIAAIGGAGIEPLDEATIEGMKEIAAENGTDPKLVEDALRPENMKRHSLRCALANIFFVQSGRSDAAASDYLIWWADNSWSWHPSIDDAFDNVSHMDPRRTGTVLVMSMESLAHRLHRAAGRAFATASLDANPDISPA